MRSIPVIQPATSCLQQTRLGTHCYFCTHLANHNDPACFSPCMICRPLFTVLLVPRTEALHLLSTTATLLQLKLQLPLQPPTRPQAQPAGKPACSGGSSSSRQNGTTTRRCWRASSHCSLSCRSAALILLQARRCQVTACLAAAVTPVLHSSRLWKHSTHLLYCAEQPVGRGLEWRGSSRAGVQALQQVGGSVRMGQLQRFPADQKHLHTGSVCLVSRGVVTRACILTMHE